jgi:predicted amidophosphoribosyltransferase
MIKRIRHKEFPNQVKTKECPSCAMEVENSLSICPICQFEFPKRAHWITGMAIFLLVVWLLSYLL